MQVIVTTHSPDVLDAKWLEERHLRMVDWREGATRLAGVSDASKKALQEHLAGAGELLRSNALEPEPHLFAEPGDLGQTDLFEDV